MFKRKDKNMLLISERSILRRIYGPVKKNGIKRSRYNDEFFTVGRFR
jgi:hypothetical protein